MTDSKHKAYRERHGCDVCGESDRKLRKLVAQVDGKKKRGWKLCRFCLSVKLVALEEAVPRIPSLAHKEDPLWP